MALGQDWQQKGLSSLKRPKEIFQASLCEMPKGYLGLLQASSFIDRKILWYFMMHFEIQEAPQNLMVCQCVTVEDAPAMVGFQHISGKSGISN